MTKTVKIKYTQLDKKSCETDTCGLNFQIIINGITGCGTWQRTGQYNKCGMGVNELLVNGSFVTIFENGGGQRHYEIRAYPDIAPKQPKDLRSLSVTGRALLTTNFKAEFINKIQKALSSPDQTAKLSDKFLQTFKLTENDKN